MDIRPRTALGRSCVPIRASMHITDLLHQICRRIVTNLLRICGNSMDARMGTQGLRSAGIRLIVMDAHAGTYPKRKRLIP